MNCGKTKNNFGCCSDLKENSFLKKRKLKGGKIKMKRNVFLWIVIGVLFIATLFLVFKVGSVNSSNLQAAGSVAKSAASSTNYGGMVGGC